MASLLQFLFLLTACRSLLNAQEYQEYRPPPEGNHQPTGSESHDIDPLFSTEVDANGRTTSDAQLNSVKRVVSHLSFSSTHSSEISIPGVRHRIFEQLHVDGSVGYPMKDILVPSNSDGTPILDIQKLNMNVPSLRKRTSYKTGKRKYLETHTSTLLEIDRGFVYAFGDDIIVADSSRVFVMGGCGENMAGWALAPTGENGQQEWDSPDLDKDGFHRFSSLAVLVQRLGRSYFHFLTSALPRLVQYLDVLRDDPIALAKLRYLAYDEPFVIDALQLLGVDVGRQIIFFDPNSVYSAETLYATSSTPCGQPPRPVLLHARQHVYNRLYPLPKIDASPAVIERNRRRMMYANRRGLIILIRDKRIENMNDIMETIRNKYMIPYKKENGKAMELIVVDGMFGRRRGVRRRSNGNGGSGNGGSGDGSKSTLGALLGKGSRTMLAEYSLWRRAELIVGTSSESLANMIWSQNGTKVVELMPILPMSKGRRATLTYADMAGSLDLTYALVPMETNSIGSNMTVPITYLEQALTMVLDVGL